MRERWIPLGIGVLILCAVSGFGGYWFATRRLEVELSSTGMTERAVLSNATTPGVSATEVINPFTGGRIAVHQLADCESAVPVIDTSGNPSGAKKSVTRVYDSSCNILVGANPRTFVALDYYYGTDSHGVWILANPSEEGAPKSIQIAGADASTFTLIPTGNQSTSYDEGYSKEYTKDNGHVYSFGQVVDGADPASFNLMNSPHVTSCVFDSLDSHLKFYRGAIVPEVAAASP